MLIRRWRGFVDLLEGEEPRRLSHKLTFEIRFAAMAMRDAQPNARGVE